MTQTVGSGVVERALDDRTRANHAFFEAEAERLARLCHRMAERFARGGRLIAFGQSPSARSDARHVAVEFVHPVIVGKRALPADRAGRARAAGSPSRSRSWPRPATSRSGSARTRTPARPPRRWRSRASAAASRWPSRPPGAEWEFEPPGPDAPVRQELVETLYHVLWELVHVFFDHRGLLEGRTARRTHDTGAASFLYPFLDEREDDLEAVVDDVRRSVLAKAEEVGELRAQTLTDNRDELLAAAGRPARRASTPAARCSRSETAARPPTRWTPWRTSGARRTRAGPPRRALDLTEDPAILTAIANDIGTEAIFARQVIAHGRQGDALLAISTSGNSANVIAALAEARRRGLGTIAMVGYDGGRVASEGLADHVVVTRSEHIPRIQEAQASAYHVLRELVA